MYDDYNDYEPWLYDSEGSYLNVYAGISWNLLIPISLLLAWAPALAGALRVFG